jgi:hypothetical protein
VGVAAPDGIILAADSRTTWAEGERHRIASDFAQKVFSIRNRVGVATYGLSFIGVQTIAGHMDEFVAQLDDQAVDDVEAISNRLGEFFQTRLEEAFAEDELGTLEGDVLGFLVAGYDENGIGHIREVGLPGPDIAGEINTASIGVLWRGQTDVVRRLIKGIDLNVLDETGSDVPDNLRDDLGALEYQLIYPITLQDAVDFGTFLIRTTIDMQRFSDGTVGIPGMVPGCGGPVRIVAVTRSGTQWVQEQPLAGPTRAGLAEEAHD